MVVEECFYDPVRDVSPVDQFGFVDLKNALATSTVPTRMPEADTDYNGIDEPGKVLGRPRDVFEAIDAQAAAEAAAAAAAADGNNQTDGA